MMHYGVALRRNAVHEVSRTDSYPMRPGFVLALT
jgi:hypothetical protein